MMCEHAVNIVMYCSYGVALYDVERMKLPGNQGKAS